AGSTAAITDASGNKWTIVNGVVDENGQAAGYSANVTEIAYVSGVVWQENASNQWWGWSNGGWNTGAGATTSPLPTTPTPPTTPTRPTTPSADDTVVLAGSTAAITDASGNKWTIVNGVVDENGKAAGYSANVAEIAYVKGTIWQVNTAGLWWSWNGTTWPGNGTSTSPLPVTTRTVTPDTIVVSAGAAGQPAT